jgi:hypothetical protein
MEKKMKIYIVIVLKCCLFGSILGMDKSACITNQSPKSSALKKSLQNGLISCWKINDYIVKVSTLWQALKKEVRLPGACLMKMKNMHREVIEFINADNRKSLIEDSIPISSIDVSQKCSSNKLKNFCSHLIVINYKGSLKRPGFINAHMDLQTFLYVPSTNELSFKKLPLKKLTTTTNYNSLQKIFNNLLQRTHTGKYCCIIELKSENNPSDWVRIVHGW